MVSQGGGAEPRWRRDGKELFYVSPEDQVMASQVSVNGATFQPGIPRALFKGQFVQGWDVSADGKKFLFPIMRGETVPTPFTVVLNSTSLLKR